MPRPIDDIAQALREAIAGALNDSESLLSKLIGEIPVGGGGAGGGATPDIVGAVLAIGGLSLLFDPEIEAVVEGVKGVQSSGGHEGAILGSGWFIGETLLKFAEPYTRYATHFFENAAQSQIFDPATAADLTARGIITHDFGASEAGGGGYDTPHFNQFAEAALKYPDFTVALRLWDLGFVDEAAVDLVMKRQGIPDEWAAQIKNLRRQYLSIADLALGQLRGDIDPADALAYANQLGMTDEDFQRFVYNTGEPIGLMQLLEAYRRGYIDQARLKRGVLQSRVRDEWFDVVLDLRFERMSAADAVNATIQNHLTTDEGQAAAALAGLFPDDFPVLLETAGEPLSRTEMTELVNRGEATVDDYAQAMRESRLKDKYIPFAEKLLVKLIPYRTINTILAHGVRDHKWGIDYLMKLGYTADDADALVSTSTSSKTAHIKQTTEAQVLELYEAKALNKAEAVKELGAIGYNADEANFILETIDAKRDLSEQNKAISFLRTGYLHDRVTDIEASAVMDKMQVPPTQRDQILADWKIERDGQVLALTAGQIVDAVYYGLVRFDDAQEKLVQMGYDNNEAKILISIRLHGAPEGVTIGPLIAS